MTRQINVAALYLSSPVEWPGETLLVLALDPIFVPEKETRLEILEQRHLKSDAGQQIR